MKYRNATCAQRFFAYFIDSIIISAISGFILQAIPLYNTSAELFAERYMSLMNNASSAEFDMEFYQEMFAAAGIMVGINMAIVLPLTILYFVVLPYFWPSQTVGRLAMGLKVVELNEEKPSLKHIILREFVGGFLIYQVLGYSGIIHIVTWVLSAKEGRSIADFVGKTRLVNIRYVNEEETYRDTSNDIDYVDAQFKELKSDNDGEYGDENQPKQNSSDDEYQVF